MEKLKQILTQEDTVLFVGSGISIWSGLPSWAGMIEELAQFVEATGVNADLVRAEARRGDLLQAASYGFDKLTKQQIGEFIRASCRYGIAKPQDIHRKIVSLGPRCFITTNYDNLIEESLRVWKPDRFFRPPITNRHLTETAEVVHARAIDFVFKPHGDAADSDSIILTREQYRQLLPQGERHGALESLKMLLASRPVVYFGFSLRDPDFIYVRDLLANTYKGGIRDHYAIMADVSEAESDYWRRNYGIHLISYTTIERPDKTKDHTELLTLLDTLLEKVSTPTQLVNFDQRTPDVVLALARYAAGLARSPKINPEFPIRVHIGDYSRENVISFKHDRFDHYLVEKFLVDGPERALLVGLPGAGKTYSLRRAATRLAEQLHEACLSEAFDGKTVILPIYADLKLYRGNLLELVSQKLPKNLPFEEILQHFKVKIFLDSFNEISREYLESGLYETDFLNFIDNIANASLIIGSRTNDGLSKLGLQEYYLDQIDESTVAVELQKLGIDVAGRFSNEVLRLLQRPFFFQYVANGTVKLSSEAHPKDFYQLFFDNLRISFFTRFGKYFDIENALSFVAYDALNRGEEAFPLSELLQTLKINIEIVGLFEIDVRDIANWLVASSILIPHMGGRVAFVHQSVTEYLAAAELARQYQNNKQILREKLSLTRWDQALFITLSLLSPVQAETFLQDVVKVDLALALNAAKYIEMGREDIVSKLLVEIPKRLSNIGAFDHKIQWALESNLPISQVHEPHLRTIMKLGNSIGAAAVLRLASLKGADIKDELLQLLWENYDDYNFCCNGVARAIQPFAIADDVKKIVAWADSIQEKAGLDSDEDDLEGFTSGAARFLADIDLSIIRQEFVPQNQAEQISEIRAEILCKILDNQHSTTALDFAGELLLRGVDQAAVAIFFIGEFANPEDRLSWTSFTLDHVLRLENILFSLDETWGLHALKCLCRARPDLTEEVAHRASNKRGIEKAALLHCVSPTDMHPIFTSLEELIAMNEDDRRKQPIQILKDFEIDWLGKEEIFVQLLKLRDMEIASSLFGGSSTPRLQNLGTLNIGQLDWWMEWMVEILRSDKENTHWWTLHQFGGLFASYFSQEDQDKFVTEFNKSDSKFRPLLLEFILPQLMNITSDVFNDDAVSFMLADLSREGRVSLFHGHLLGKIATEQFVVNRLLPVLLDAKPPLLQNLQKVIKQAGTRHGRRYIPELQD